MSAWAGADGDLPELDFGQLASPAHLPSLTSAERDHLLEQMRSWVAELVTRFHIDTRVIPPCWEQHNGMVEALSALRDLERDCYSDKAPASAGVDWFRGYREIEARLIELASLTNCTAHEHRQPPAGWPVAQANPWTGTGSASGAPARDVT
ncbi:hypothetical protein GCM10027053_47790 [Intrasporangium mesophilum]